MDRLLDLIFLYMEQFEVDFDTCIEDIKKKYMKDFPIFDFEDCHFIKSIKIAYDKRVQSRENPWNAIIPPGTTPGDDAGDR